MLGWLYTGPLNRYGGGNQFERVGKVQSGGLWPYLGQTNAYWCPLDLVQSTLNSYPKRPSPFGLPATYKELFARRGQQMTSYICNGAVSGYSHFGGTNQPNTLKVSAFKPTNYLLWESDEAEPGWFNDGSSFPSEGFSWRHNIGATLGGMGGHVEYLKYRKWEQLLRAPGPNDFYCSPVHRTGQP